ncbi:TonB-dependent receptor [Sphingobium amiense]|uniref:TonB-dependent receptor n=1 Tax=Sphingobium amiense TaxID=135719 RepID=A0A494W826_9SPHN|nr:TonB-dependent receptor [Sphingobium amiense]BBD96790.1 TonB-dependent receptor [Sphingobium amiense]
MNSLVRRYGTRLLCAAAHITVLAAAPALAQSAPAADSAQADAPGTIVVTASRLGRRDVPTPQLALDATVLSQGGRLNAVAALQDFPQFRPSSTPATNGGQTAGGGYGIDLRALGIPRTLSLLNGHRFSSGSGDLPMGYTDVGVIPSILIERVDIVTSSAAATWGSGAVAGVVNFVTTDKLEGARVGLQSGISSRGDGFEGKAEAAYGTTFGGGRGRIIIGGEYSKSEGIDARSDRKNVGRWAALANAGQTPTLTPNVGLNNISRGGLITNGFYAGQSFNPDHTLSPYNGGTLVGVSRVGGIAPSSDDVVNLIAPLTRIGVMGRLFYDLGSDVRLTADVLYSHATANSSIFPQSTTSTISIDNAFLPQAIKDGMLAAGQTSFSLGRFNDDYAALQDKVRRDTFQGTVSLDGRLGSKLQWNAYYTHGSLSIKSHINNSLIASNFAQAVDSVKGANGQPVCRVTLTTPSSNCVPINLFGEGAPSQAARDYVLGTAIANARNSLDAGGVSLRGDVLDLWAGPLSIAVGAEARRESLHLTNGPLDRAKAFVLVNAPAYGGEIKTAEGFGEFMLPILKDVPGFSKLQLNGAARYSNNDQSKGVWSWKIGVLDRVVEGVEVRATRSRDIRAPGVNELFATVVGPQRGIFFDPLKNTSYQMSTFTGGNRNLKVELSDTTTFGVTLTPSFAPGLTITADYYNINIKNAISAPSTQTVLTNCGNGIASSCALITRADDGTATSVLVTNQNFLSYKASGVDFSLRYPLPISILSGVTAIRLDGSWLRKLETNDGKSVVNLIGTTGAAAVNGAPKLSGNAALTYDSSTFSAYLRVKYVSPSWYNRAITITNNRYAAYATVDLGLNYQVTPGMKIFANVNNLFDRDPPIASGRSVYYDFIGRYYQSGVRLSF